MFEISIKIRQLRSLVSENSVFVLHVEDLFSEIPLKEDLFRPKTCSFLDQFSEIRHGGSRFPQTVFKRDDLSSENSTGEKSCFEKMQT